MEFTFKKIENIGSNLLVVFINNKKNLPSFFEKNSNKILSAIHCFNEFEFKFQQMILCTVDIDHHYTRRVLFCGLSEIERFNNVDIQKFGGDISDKLNDLKVVEADIYIDNTELNARQESFILNLCEGIKLKNYSFNKYFINKKERNKLYLERVNIHCNLDWLEEKFLDRSKIIEATHFVRDLVSEPGNILNPESFLPICKDMMKIGVKVKIIDKRDLQRLGMNAILAVGQGSDSGTYVVTMEWCGDKSCKDKENLIAFVGKGVTFDTGGINLKPSGPSISTMKYDMGGAAVVTGLIQSLARRKAKVNAIGVIGLAENMISGGAQRPGDVIKSMSGQTIEVDNTDAEGRLLLADIMWYVQENYKIKLMIDLATLTGAIVHALGHHYAGLFSNNDTLAKQLHEAGEHVGEGVWRLPLEEYYDNLIDSKIADVKNTGRGGAGSITAAQFLHRFVKQGCSWAHIDIAGVNWLDDGGKLSPRGATGYGVRLLNEFISKNYENTSPLST